MNETIPGRNPSVGIGLKPTRVRYGIVLMLFVTVVINYLDRGNLAVAAPQLAEDLKFDSKHMGWLLSAFGWAYATLQIPGGWLVDRVRPRILYALICGLWSLATVLQGLVGLFAFLFGLRLLLGVFEAPAFPICNRVVTTWVPERERAGAIGFYTSGQFVGLAFLQPLLFETQRRFGWQYIFIFTGAVGLLWAAMWYWLYRDPADSSRVNEQEIQHIKAGGGLADLSVGQPVASRAKFEWADLKKVLSSRKLWGIYIGQFGVTSTMWFFLSWFHTYLVKYRHLDFIKDGFSSSWRASAPFLAAFCGVIASGLFSDFLIKRGISVSTARKAPIITGLLLSTSIVGANYVNDPNLIVLFLSLAFFGSGFSSIAWIMVSSTAPKRLLGLTGGVFNFFGNLPSITVPIVLGYLARPDDFASGLVFIACVALAGALSYIFLVGKVERIE